jgi:hypothetical protein
MNIDDVVAGCPRLTLSAGSTLSTEQVHDAELVVLEQGLVVLRSLVPGSARQTITCTAGAGRVVLPPGPDEALTALSDAILRPISAHRRGELLESPAAARALLDGLAETLRQKHTALANMARLHHVDRIRETLVELARAHGRVGTDGVRLDFPLTQHLLGEMTGSARETVSRALDQLQREGFVVRHGRTYSVHVSPEDLAM